MKQTLSTSEAAHQLYSDENAGWTWAGATALVKHLEELEEGQGEEMVFDRVGIRCDYSEYASLEEAFFEYCPDAKDLLLYIKGCRGRPRPSPSSVFAEYFAERTTIIEFDGGVIVENF